MDLSVIPVFGYFIKTRNIFLSWILLCLVTANHSKPWTPKSGSASHRNLQHKNKGHRQFSYSDRDYATRTPSILPTKNNYTVKRGSLAILHCTVQNLGTKTVVWRKATEENPITVGEYTYVSDSRFSTQHKSRLDQWNLHIRNVSLSDEGTYECQVSTKDRSIRRKFQLDVQDWSSEPNAAIVITGKKFVEKGDAIELSCNATGDYYAPEDIDWFKDGDKLDSDKSRRTIITKQVFLNKNSVVSDLKIYKARMKDAGDYLCRISEKYITTIHVQVLNADSNNNVKRGTQYDNLHAYDNSSTVKPIILIHLLTLMFLSLT